MTDIIDKIEVKKDELFKPLETKKYNPYIDTRTKEQKIIVHVELDPELLEKIDQEAAKDLRTRKAQVLYIIREHFNKSEEK